jgi:RNase H-like domain found in reverse transcriptase
MYISQLDLEGRLRSIAFYSRKMISIELNYKIYDKELLVIIEAFRE